MIISASRRTDIAAFYAPWMMNRLRAGYCTVPNPFNRKQVSHILLDPRHVDAIVFWTRNPRPLVAHLPELDEMGHRYYFQYTVMNNPRAIDPKSPPKAQAVDTFRNLSARIGPRRVIWRYDPIVFTKETTVDFHRAKFDELADLLEGNTTRVVVSVVDYYKKAAARFRELRQQGLEVLAPEPFLEPLFAHIAASAAAHGMKAVSCAEELDLRPHGILPGKCVDDELLRNVFGRNASPRKDAGQREACGCVVSRDIGMYDSCLYGCQYCYATTNFATARGNHAAHDAQSPSLLGHYEPDPALCCVEGGNVLPSDTVCKNAHG